MRCDFCGTDLAYDKLNTIVQVDHDEPVMYMKHLVTLCDCCVQLVYDYIQQTKDQIKAIQALRNALHKHVGDDGSTLL